MKSILISETTYEEREEIVKDGIALSTLDCQPPTEFAMKLNRCYINGEIEISDMKKLLLKHYGISESNHA